MKVLYASTGFRLIAVAAALVCTLAAAPGGTFSGPAPYLSTADSPFSAVSFSYSYVEDFEDGALNTPGVAASTGWAVLGPGPLTDSVDADDGAIDALGTGGHSYYSTLAVSSLTFVFSEAALGELPTHVGLVWTDVGNSSLVQGTDLVTFSAKDAFGVSLGSIGPFLLGDGVATGGTAEDRFFGISNAAGVSEITITSAGSIDWEVDHLQYGREVSTSVPDAGGIQLFLLAGLALAAASVLTHARKPRTVSLNEVNSSTSALPLRR